MPFFQATAVTYTAKIAPLFQGLIDNEREEGFRWLLQQQHALLRTYNLEDPDLYITDYDDTLINTLNFEFPTSRY